MKHQPLALATLITLIRSISAAAPPCYSPAGRRLPGYGVCDPRLAASVCCGSGDVCLSNGLCSNPAREFYRGGCSDLTYKSGLCPAFCVNDPFTAFVSVCDPNGGTGGIHLCCDAGRKRGTCCNNQTEVFTLAAPFSSITAGPASATNPPTANDDSTGPTSTSSGTIVFEFQRTVTPTSPSTPQAPSIDPTSPAAAADAAHRAQRLSIGAIAGATVGGALLLLSLAALLLYCIRRRRKRTQRPAIRVIKANQHELPGDDDDATRQRQNSRLFPAELVSKSARGVPAELEIRESKAPPARNPAELDIKGSTAPTPSATRRRRRSSDGAAETDGVQGSEAPPPPFFSSSSPTGKPAELGSAAADEYPPLPGPFELQSNSSRRHGEKTHDDPATAAKNEKDKDKDKDGGIIIPRSSSHYSRDTTGWEDVPSVAADAAGPQGGPRKVLAGLKRPSFRRRPDSSSGPWHDSYDEKGVFF
ncbi:MAG: hypothetical protein Q9173_002836 [Seirophora scorigena]